MSIRLPILGLTNKEKHRLQCITALKNIYDALDARDELFIPDSDHTQLQIRCQQLTFDRYGTPSRVVYFQPMPEPTFNNHPINKNCANAGLRRHMQFMEDEIDAYLTDQSGIKVPLRNNASSDTEDVDITKALSHVDKILPAQDSANPWKSDFEMEALFLCSVMSEYFEDFPRMNTAKDRRGLRSETDWWPTSGTIREEFVPSIYVVTEPTRYPDDFWTNRQDNFPHITFTMRHSIEIRGDDNRLLRGEVLTTLAVMRTRLDKPILKDHLIIPVMVLSFMGNRCGRILLCYFDGTDLVIHISPLFNFSSMKEAQLSIQIFVQCLASTPVGDTKHIPPKSVSTAGSASAGGQPGVRQSYGSLRGLFRSN